MTFGDGTEDELARRARGMSAACGSLREEYERTGHIAHLDRAVAAGRICIDLTAEEHPLRPRRLSNLALALRLRFEHLGAPEDLLDSIRIARQALGSDPKPADLPRLQSNLGVTLRVLFDMSAARDHLVEAAALTQAALDGTPVGHPDRPGMLSNLGLALLELGEADDDQESVGKAVVAVAAAFDGTTDEDTDRPMYAVNLSVALRLRGAAVHRPDDVDAAVAVAEYALGLLPDQHPDQAGVLSDLGRARRLRATLTGNADDARVAVELRRKASGVRAAPAVVRALAARAWGIWAAEDGALADAADGYAAAVELLSQIAWHGLTGGARERHLSRWRGLAQDAAAASLRAGYPERALRMLEQGRTVLWNEQLDRLGDFGLLHDASPATAEQLLAIRDVLDVSTQRMRARYG